MQGIYKIANKVNGKYYVGSSKDVGHRWETHREGLARGDHGNLPLQNAWNKYGMENFVFKLAEEVLGGRDARLRREQDYLDKGFSRGALYNVAKRADCPPSLNEFSEESKQKRRKAIQEWYRTHDNPFKGKCHMSKTRAKMSESHKGENNPRGMLGKRHTKESKMKMSRALSGRNITWGDKISKANQEALKGNTNGAKSYPAFYNEKTNEFILAGRNLASLCEEQDLSYSTFTNLKLGITNRAPTGWRLANEDEVLNYGSA